MFSQTISDKIARTRAGENAIRKLEQAQQEAIDKQHQLHQVKCQRVEAEKDREKGEDEKVFRIKLDDIESERESARAILKRLDQEEAEATAVYKQKDSSREQPYHSKLKKLASELDAGIARDNLYYQTRLEEATIILEATTDRAGSETSRASSNASTIIASIEKDTELELPLSPQAIEQKQLEQLDSLQESLMNSQNQDNAQSSIANHIEEIASSPLPMLFLEEAMTEVFTELSAEEGEQALDSDVDPETMFMPTFTKRKAAPETAEPGLDQKRRKEADYNPFYEKVTPTVAQAMTDELPARTDPQWQHKVMAAFVKPSGTTPTQSNLRISRREKVRRAQTNLKVSIPSATYGEPFRLERLKHVRGSWVPKDKMSFCQNLQTQVFEPFQNDNSLLVLLPHLAIRPNHVTEIAFGGGMVLPLDSITLVQGKDEVPSKMSMAFITPEDSERFACQLIKVNEEIEMDLKDAIRLDLYLKSLPALIDWPQQPEQAAFWRRMRPAHETRCAEHESQEDITRKMQALWARLEDRDRSYWEKVAQGRA